MSTRSMSMFSRVAVAAAVAVATGVAAAAAPAAQAAPAAEAATAAGGHGTARPSKVVIVVVDALSREIVEKYDMKNVKALMRDQVNSPNAYLGHLGSVTVVTHNVITSGQLPKHMGWTDDGYRDVDGVLGPVGGFWTPSDWGKDEMFAVQKAAEYPKLADYLHAAKPGSKVYTVSPKAYAAWAFGGAGSDTILTFGSTVTCPDGQLYRAVDGVNVPDYLSKPCGQFYVHQLGSGAYDTSTYPASLYPLDGDRYTRGEDPAHPGGDVWAANAAIQIMKHDPTWSGLFVTMPGVDKAAHMWGSIDDKGGAVPATHLRDAAKVADYQVGRIIKQLKDSGEFDNTLVVLTADHGSVPGRNFYGTPGTGLDDGYYNWYYGESLNGSYLQPQEALQPLVATGNVGLTYSDSMLRAWLKDSSADKVKQAAAVISQMPGVSATWVRAGDRYGRVSPIRWDRMHNDGEKSWFGAHAQELVDTEAAAYGPEVIATLVDDTTYSVAGDHGGIQRRAQQIPIVFAGADLPRTDLAAPIRSVDIMPTILRTMGIAVTTPMDGIGYRLPGAAG